jgi:hypothetical protein
MWALANRTPYAAERSWVQDKDANKIWIVVVKATFDIAPDGSARLADDQVPVLRAATHRGEPGAGSVIYDGDLLGVKTRTDVLLNASAWSLDGPVTSLDVRMRVGPLSKQLRVFGDRVWDRGLIAGVDMSPPQRFESMPITYERAFGGWDRGSENPVDHRLESRNPVGTGFGVRAEHCRGKRLANVEYPSATIGSWKDRPAPAGFGAIDCHWSPRRELAGTYDERWRTQRFPLWAEDFDPRYHNCAPHDQQPDGFLRGGEAVELVNLSRHGVLTFALPRVYPFFQTRFGRSVVEHRAQLATVILEPDGPRVIMAWQTSLVCNHKVDELDTTVVTEKRAM